MEILTVLLIVALLALLWNYRKIMNKIGDIQKAHNEELSTEAWLHESNLQLLKKAIKNRISSLDKHAKFLEDAAKERIAAAEKREAETRDDCKRQLEEAARFKLWKLTIKHGIESPTYPDRLIVMAETKEEVVDMVQKKFNIDDITGLYDIVQKKKNKSEILLTSYSIL